MVDVHELLRLDVELKVYVGDVFSSLRRKGWQERSHCHLTGLMLDGRRKSVEPMAARLGEANDQSLGNFLANTPWDPVPVQARLARKMDRAIDPAGWVVDDSGFTKDGRMSPCVARQYTGTVGKITNCQVATTLHLASDQASCPIGWRLFMPESWIPIPTRPALMCTNDGPRPGSRTTSITVRSGSWLWNASTRPCPGRCRHPRCWPVMPATATPPTSGTL